LDKIMMVSNIEENSQSPASSNYYDPTFNNLNNPSGLIGSRATASASMNNEHAVNTKVSMTITAGATTPSPSMNEHAVNTSPSGFNHIAAGVTSPSFNPTMAQMQSAGT
jgi:hypothetical protein